jgi:Protein of unknown function (DUF402)
MPADEDAVVPFPVGSTAVRRDTLGGKIWTAAPHRVVRDSGSELLLTRWPGVESIVPATYIQWLLTGDDAARKQAIPNLAAGRWELGRWTWRDTTVLSWFSAGEYFSVRRYLRTGRRPGAPAGWYVNFELPFRRTRIGIDTFDLLLDLVAEPGLAGYAWKDEGEYAHARRLGLIDDALHARVGGARQRAVSLIRGRQGPFAHDWSRWRRDPRWPVPTLPPGAMDVPAQA